MKLPFLDRARESARLRRHLQGAGPSLLCLYGRRRCGKSRLIREVLGGTPHVYYVADERESVLQRRAMAREMARLVPRLDAVEYPGWEELLERWWREAPPGAALAIDEFPWLVARVPELPSLLQKWIDVAPARQHVEHYHREPGGAWDLTHLSDGAVRLPDLGGVMLLEELYLSDGP